MPFINLGSGHQCQRQEMLRRLVILSNEKVLHEKLIGEEGAAFLLPLLVSQRVLQLAGVEGVEGLVDADVIRLHGHLIGERFALVQCDLVLARNNL